MIRFILFILSLFKGIISSMGVDYQQLRAILRIKLTMDNRRGLATNNRKKKSAKNQLILQGFLYAFIGLYFSFFIGMIKVPIVAYLTVFGIIMIMIAVMMISEFSTVLIDTRDNYIILPRPVNSKTMAMSKILHIGIYLTHISLSLSIASIITTWVKYGFAAACLFVVCLIMATFFTLFLTNIFYLGLMKYVNGEKLKDILVYFQIFMAILFMGAYQIMPRIMDMEEIANPQLHIHWWTYLIPPAWFGGTMEAVIQGTLNQSHIIFVITAILVPPLSLYMVIKWLSPKFNERIGQLDVASSKSNKKRIEKSKRNSYSKKMARIFTNTQTEATAFKMIWLMSGRERKYKQTVFPSFGYVFIFGLVFAFNSFKNIGEHMATLDQGKDYLIFIYMTAFAALAITMNLIYSDEPKSSWFYRSLPLEAPGLILCGAIKSVLVKYFMPLFLSIAIPILYIWGISVIFDILYAFIAIILAAVMISSLQLRSFPFSKERETQDSSGNFLKGILIMISMGIMGLIHWGLSFVPYSMYVAIPIMIGLLFFSFKYFSQIGWEKME